jgi:hypothetical protein
MPADDTALVPVTDLLPPLPEPAEDDEAELVALVLFRQGATNIRLTDYEIALADAQGYCDREDTHGDGWFVGFWRA